MADFRTKLITLAGMATVFAGMAFAQTNVTVASTGLGANAIFVRGEGTNEQLADSTVTFTAGLGVTPSVNLTVYLSPSVAITSANYKPGGTTFSEATAVYSGTNYPGVVSGNSVTFSGIPVAVGGGVVTITNIKVNASTVATSTGIPTAITETVFVGGTGVTPTVPTPATAAYVTNGLGSVKLSGTNFGNTICSATSVLTTNFKVSITEGFATAFKTQGGNGNTLGAEFTNNTETGYYLGSGAAPASTNNIATSGTRISIAFANVPANVSVYVPLNYSLDNGVNNTPLSTLTLVKSATAATSGTNSVADAGLNGGEPAGGIGAGDFTQVGAVTITNGTGTAVYEETLNNPAAIETYVIPVFLSSAAGAVTAPTTAITATVTLGPIGATSNVPNFISGSSTATVNGSNYTACTTSLLFPFVTSGSGFDTGIAIANTSVDALGLTSKGAVTTSVAAQSGTCALSFYGATGAPTAPVVSPTVASGTTWANSASSLAPGFTGYAIATCNFLYAHGFAYITYNLTQSSGAAMGYLSLPIATTGGNTPTRTASSSAPESLGN